MAASITAAASSRSDTVHGHIAARIDRLPLTAIQWRLAILVEITWGFIIFDTDGIGARLYPFVWRPSHIFTNPLYRGRTIVVLICWLLGYAGLIYGAGAFTAVYMVDHGANAHFVFLTIAAAYALTFVAFQINARISEGIERRDVLFVMGCLFSAAWVVIYLAPNLWVIAAFYMVGRVGTGLWLFNLYNYTAVAYPTRIRAVAFAWTDGLGHLGAWAGVTLLGPLYAYGPNHLGWFLWLLIPGSLLPAIVIRTFGVKQAGVVLEHVSA